jgi:hypothetical protein
MSREEVKEGMLECWNVGIMEGRQDLLNFVGSFTVLEVLGLPTFQYSIIPVLLLVWMRMAKDMRTL